MGETDAPSLFSDEIETARNRFLTACDRIGLRVVSHPARNLDGPTGLVCDVTRLGSPEARKAVVLCSGAAGQAGLLGCAAALNCVAGEGLKDLPREIALVLIHAANPKGPIWPYFAPGDESRSTELPPAWSDSVLEAAERRFSDYQEKGGIDWREMGGRTLSSMAPPAWDSEVLKAIAGDQLKQAEQVCVLDIRTGPGTFGAHTLIPCDPEHSAARARAEQWFTIDLEAAEQAVGTAGTPCGGGLSGLLKTARATNVLVEVGTYSMAGVLSGGRRDATSAYPTSPQWRGEAWQAIRISLSRAYTGLLSTHS